MEAVEGRNVSISAGTSFDLPLMVKAPSHVEWSFSFAQNSAGMDINFGVHLKGAPSAHGPADVEVAPMTVLTDPQDGTPQTGAFDVDVGVCYFVWDNKASWFTAKTVSYKIKLSAKDADDAVEGAAAPPAAPMDAVPASAEGGASAAEVGAVPAEPAAGAEEATTAPATGAAAEEEAAPAAMVAAAAAEEEEAALAPAGLAAVMALALEPMQAAGAGAAAEDGAASTADTAPAALGGWVSRGWPPLVLRVDTPLVLGRRDKKKGGGTDEPPSGLEISDQKVSRKQATVTLSTAGAGGGGAATVTMAVGGNNPSCVCRATADGVAPAADTVPKGESVTVGMGDVVEIDGYKRLNTRKYPDGPQFGFRLVEVPL